MLRKFSFNHLTEFQHIMAEINNLIALTRRLLFKLKRKKIYENIKSLKTNYWGSALLYFKTDPLVSRSIARKYIHTNNAEILMMIKILNKHGLAVDVIDRDVTIDDLSNIMKKKYDIYIANAAGNSAPLHNILVASLSASKKVFYAAGPDAFTSNQLVSLRHSIFRDRTNANCVERRIVNTFAFHERFRGIDAIFCIGNEFSISSYAKYNIPVHRIYPSTHPSLNIRYDELRSKKSDHFLYFGGNGLICKGLDLVIECFLGLEHLKLDICCPVEEVDFWDYYGPKIQQSENITFHGFVDVNSEKFNHLTRFAAFQVYPASAEGCATSVTTCMRRAVIPLLTIESGVDLKDFGYLIDDISINGLQEKVRMLSEEPYNEIYRRAIRTYIESHSYTGSAFETSFEAAILCSL